MWQNSKFKIQNGTINDVNYFGVMDDDCGEEDYLFMSLIENHSSPQPSLQQEEIINISNKDKFKAVNGLFEFKEGIIEKSNVLESSMNHDRQLSQPRLLQSSLNASLIDPTSRQDHYVMTYIHQFFSQEITNNGCTSSQLLQQKCQIPANRQAHLEEVCAIQENLTPKKKKIKKQKKDEQKNMYGYSFKFIVKEFISSKYQPFLERLCEKWGVTNKTKVKQFYSQTLKRYISLKELRDYLDYKKHEDSMRRVKQVFHDFYVWFMRKRYTLHVLKLDKIIHKEKYLKAKNYLIYLPDLKQKSKFRVSSSKR